MKYLKLAFYFFLGLFLTLLDVSLLSNFEFFGATILTSFSLLIVLAVSDRLEDLAYYSLGLVILFAVFSSLPLFLIMINFVFLPLVISYVRRRYFHKPSEFAVLLYLILGNFLFEAILVVWAGELNKIGLLLIMSFVIINTVCGFLINILFSKVRTGLFTEKIKT